MEEGCHGQLGVQVATVTTLEIIWCGLGQALGVVCYRRAEQLVGARGVEDVAGVIKVGHGGRLQLVGVVAPVRAGERGAPGELEAGVVSARYRRQAVWVEDVAGNPVGDGAAVVAVEADEIAAARVARGEGPFGRGADRVGVSGGDSAGRGVGAIRVEGQLPGSAVRDGPRSVEVGEGLGGLCCNDHGATDCRC